MRLMYAGNPHTDPGLSFQLVNGLQVSLKRVSGLCVCVCVCVCVCALFMGWEMGFSVSNVCPEKSCKKEALDVH